MIKKINDKYKYLKLKPKYFSKSNIFPLIENPIDIILDLGYIEAPHNSLLGLITDLNNFQISRSLCLVIINLQFKSNSKKVSLNIVPTLQEAEDYIQMEQIQRDLGI
tara:strand:- start:25963 stop:26283 length:321 start_codon:yes stop_codon:yes gene_type:complete